MAYIIKVKGGTGWMYYNENSTSLHVDKKRDAQRFPLRRDAVENGGSGTFKILKVKD